MFEDVLESITDFFDTVDRKFTKLFSEQWPPIRSSRPTTHVTYVTYTRRHTYHESVQTTTHRSSYAATTTLRTRTMPASPARKSWAPGTQSPRTLSVDVNRPKPTVRKSGTTSQQKEKPQTRAALATGITRPTSTPTVIENSRSKQTKQTLGKSTTVQSARPQRIKLDDIQPDLAQCDVLVIAIAEMEICKEVFAGWRAQLNLADPRKRDKLELSIVRTVDKLDIGASAALRASHSLLRNYRTLIQTIERSLNNISQSRIGGNLFSAEVSQLANTITAHSRALSRYVRQLQDRLRQLVRDIEKTKESADKRALKRKIWKWVSVAFKALSVLLSAGAIAGASMLSGAAARLCDLVQDRYNESTFDEILAFLRDHIPESAKAAEIALTSFQACHRILQVELEVRKGRQSGWLMLGNDSGWIYIYCFLFSRDT
ncbi:uncharacterized protein FOMMEDRAFT_25908 [Fomitiporia mediterranea MF3/22]|uniref:uncharacterized protein n=1 Tax=Fomitiporia mediterranea (strain MF3/22) TaxID=694068 RepID=UPI0004408E7B|nr:uncharacterized protein FOMMEDRAFT_25908 [Fomitiporia mediterranea MF3/22]EJD06697.1 hypothetical protein FOMMEDRAFT_25908 [Fomitiporia mediterranea MF3/22]